MVDLQGLTLPLKGIRNIANMNIFLAVETAFTQWEAMQNVGH